MYQSDTSGSIVYCPSGEKEPIGAPSRIALIHRLEQARFSHYPFCVALNHSHSSRLLHPNTPALKPLHAWVGLSSVFLACFCQLIIHQLHAASVLCTVRFEPSPFVIATFSRSVLVTIICFPTMRVYRVATEPTRRTCC